jgi:hypothetical protein
VSTWYLLANPTLEQAPLSGSVRLYGLRAARLGKPMLVVYDDRVTFVRKIAAEQASARIDANVDRDRTATERIGTDEQPPTPPFVLAATTDRSRQISGATQIPTAASS